MRKINWDKVDEIRGYNQGYNQTIDVDQVAHEGIAAYHKYILIMQNGEEIEISKKEMQMEVNNW